MQIGRYSKGFSLIELMIVVAIIAIIAAIAYPSYQSYVKKTKRVEDQAELLSIASHLQRYKVANATFRPNNVPVTLAMLGYPVNSDGHYSFPRNQTATYTISLSDVTANGWRMNARPRNTQLGDGYLGLNHNGLRCWNKSDVMWCQPNRPNGWDQDVRQ